MIRVIVVLLTLFFLDKAAFAEKIVADHIQIIFDTKASRKISGSKKEKKLFQKDFQRSCDKLGKSLLVGSGPWGFGVFNTFGCYYGKKHIGGLDRKSKWQLLIKSKAQSIVFESSFTSSAGTFVELAKISFDASKSFFKFFADDEFTDIVAFSLLEKMPMGASVVKARISGSPPQFSGRYIKSGRGSSFKYETPGAPTDLVLFTLEWSEEAKSWRSNVIGTAKKVKVIEPSRKKRKSRLKGGSVIFEVDSSAMKVLSAEPVWAQNASGPGVLSEELSEVREDALEKLQSADAQGRLSDFINGKISGVLDQLLDTAASGYVALRYGRQALKGDEMINKTSIFGLLLEVRGGPLRGLRYYYDKMPKVELSRKIVVAGKREDITTSIESARHVLGFSFDFNPGFLIDKITVDPKLGRWNFNAVLPTEKDENGEIISVRTFDLGNTFSTALEIGAEMLNSWYTLRGWYSIDSGFSLLKSGGRVTSNRFGLDAYFTAGPSFPIFGIPFKTALLAFFFYEDVSLKLGDPENPQPGDTAIKEVGYGGGFAGAGVGITW